MANHFGGGASLHSLMRQVDTDDLQLLNLISHDVAEFIIYRKGLPFPSFVNNFLSYENFIDLRQLNDFTIDEYELAKTSYETFESFAAYGEKSVQVDTYALASLIVNYAVFTMKTFNGLCPLWDISIGGYSFSALHYISKTNYKTWEDPRIIRAVDSSLLPGISISNVRQQTFQNPELGDDCSNGENSYCIYADVQSQY